MQINRVTQVYLGNKISVNISGNMLNISMELILIEETKYTKVRRHVKHSGQGLSLLE